MQPPQPTPAGSTATSQGTPSASDKWHRVFVSGRPNSSGARGETQDAVDVDSESHRLENRGNGAVREEATSSGDSSTALFVVTSESGMTATVDLSQFSIRWLSFRGSNEEGNGGGQGGGAGGGDCRSERKGKSRERDKLPPGFGAGDAIDGGLVYGSADVGTRIDVWWPRYNAYYRATVRLGAVSVPTETCGGGFHYVASRRVGWLDTILKISDLFPLKNLVPALTASLTIVIDVSHRALARSSGKESQGCWRPHPL